MQLHEFLGRVQQQAHLDSEQAALEATRATLATLNETLSSAESKEMASQLPRLVKQYLQADDEWRGQDLDTREFFDRVAQREGVDSDAGRNHARAVLQVVNEAVSTGEMEHVVRELPEEYHDLFGNISQTKPI